MGAVPQDVKNMKKKTWCEDTTKTEDERLVARRGVVRPAMTLIEGRTRRRDQV